MTENNRILIIDDDRSIWESYQSVLNRNPAGSTASADLQALLHPQASGLQRVSRTYQLSFAQQGEEGYRKLKEANEQDTPFALAFVDVRMPPGWNGVETARAIREIDDEIEIVIVTAFADISRTEMVEKIGKPEKLLYLRKPFDAEELAQIALQLSEKWRLSAEQKKQHRHINALLQELRDTRNYLNSMINSMQSILVGISEQLRVTHWNWVAENATGITHDRAIGREISHLFPEIPSLESLIQSCIRDYTPKLQDKLALTFGKGEERLYELRIYPLEAGSGNGVVMRMDDISERSRIEEIMLQSDRMLTVGGLAAGMAHEINTPLGSIIQSAQVIARRLDRDNRKNREVADALGLDLQLCHDYMQERGIFRLLESIRESGGRTSKIVRSMLSFSHQGTATTPTPVNEVIDEALDLAKSDYDLKKRYRFTDFEIVRDYARNLPLLSLDRTKLEQVIFNLVRNSAQAMVGMPPGHKPCIRFRTWADEDAIHIQIEDNGTGIDEETQKRIFDPFFTTKEVGTGTGLGLSLAYFIINRQHNGTIAVDSVPGQGATFNIRLPLNSTLSGRSESNVNPSPESAKLH